MKTEFIVVLVDSPEQAQVFGCRASNDVDVQDVRNMVRPINLRIKTRIDTTNEDYRLNY